MTNKMGWYTKGKLRKQFENVCQSYLRGLDRLWGKQYGYWIGDEIGGMWDNGDLAISLLDIIFIVERDITYSEVSEWQDYCAKAGEYGQPTINLMSWHNGAPRLTDEDFEELRKLKEKIMGIIDETKD